MQINLFAEETQLQKLTKLGDSLVEKRRDGRAVCEIQRHAD